MIGARASVLAVVVLQGPLTDQQVFPQGCWDTALGSWYPVPETQFSPEHGAPPPDTYGDSIFYAVPPRIRLDGTPFADREGQFDVTIPENALQTLHSMRWWSVERDSLFVSLSTGMVGVRARLGRAGDGWAGTVRTQSDVGGRLRYERSVRLLPVRCEDPPPVPASADRALPRGVQVEGGTTVVLARALPEGLATTPRRTGALYVDAPVRGDFEGADSLVVRIARNGLVSRIDLIYPVAFDFPGLVRSFEARLGNGETRWGGAYGWSNRTTWLQAVASPNGTAPHRVILSDPRQGYQE